jgi:hypothetical protein
MTMISLADRCLVKLSWVDATNVVGGWHDAADLDEWAANGAWEASNTGWIVYEDASCYVLAGRMTDDGEHVGLLERIPKQAVTEFQVIVSLPERMKA